MDSPLKFQYYARLSLFFVGLFTLIFILYTGCGIILPVIFTVIIAIVLHPVLNLLVSIGKNQVVFIWITLLLPFLAIAGAGTLLFSQISRFGGSWPKFAENFTTIFNQTVRWTAGSSEFKLEVKEKQIRP